MKVTIENGKIKVESAYNKEWVKRAKELGGRWNAPCWVLPEENEELVREALMNIYGEDGRPVEMVTVDIAFGTDENFHDDIVVAGKTIARRRYRDSNVMFENGAVLVSGGFDERGGSAKYPMIGTPHENTVIRISVPKNMLDKINRPYTVTASAKVNKAALEAEKAALLKRLQEIENLLNA